MSDDLSRLRQTMSELAEYGGSADLYEPTLRRSRRIGRRRAIVSASAAVVAVLAIGVPVAFAQQPGSPPFASRPTGGATGAPRPAAMSPSTTIPDPARPSSPGSRPAHAASGCPVSASTLQKAAKLSAGWKLDASSVKCKQNWAIADTVAPSPDQQGDGMLFFKYDAGTGTWRKKGEGSAVECGAGDPMGVPASTGFCNTS
ncbi:hypothetical protein [Krasilnikovia sp. M28-CT-15]|uniref:hypothetical protein n=1 Tax=Krasilnikovia sp. M28-CT-15 TaxID=3373540 RepID=UPI003876AE12